jgi:hypothetical protein
MADRPATAEIEVTPAMIEAGVSELVLYSTSTDSLVEIVRSVFTAMATASQPSYTIPQPVSLLHLVPLLAPRTEEDTQP